MRVVLTNNTNMGVQVKQKQKNVTPMKVFQVGNIQKKNTEEQVIGQL